LRGRGCGGSARQNGRTAPCAAHLTGREGGAL